MRMRHRIMGMEQMQRKMLTMMFPIIKVSAIIELVIKIVKLITALVENVSDNSIRWI